MELTKEDEALLFKAKNFFELTSEECYKLVDIYRTLGTLKRLEEWAVKYKQYRGE